MPTVTEIMDKRAKFCDKKGEPCICLTCYFNPVKPNPTPDLTYMRQCGSCKICLQNQREERWSKSFLDRHKEQLDNVLDCKEHKECLH